MMEKTRIVIPCAKGIPPFLGQEILSLGLPILVESVSAVKTEGTLHDAMRLNLHIRTGQRVLFLIETLDSLSTPILLSNSRPFGVMTPCSSTIPSISCSEIPLKM